GHLVLEVPAPERLLHRCKYLDSKEFTHLRYTACTVDPDDFAVAKYSLRQVEYSRPTELFVVVTMYNEDEFLFCKTMTAVMKNIAYLCNRRRSSTWAESGWKKAVICIVSDGRAKISPRVLAVLGVMGVYQEELMREKVNDAKVTAHIFEYTAQVCVSPEMEVKGHENGLVPVQILFCLKEKNAKKINSHRWFFNAFGQVLRPNVCVLIDVGTKPSTSSLYHLWKVFDRDPSVGGACGEIYAELGPGCSKLYNPLVAAQNFEYKMSNILDKPLESVLGYISVLPGAFSAYKYSAIQGMPLQQYFKGETMEGGGNIFAANMYLAEDRILCFELVTKVGQAWLLRYVKAAKAETDVPSSVPEFISQRRRWLNGSFFASFHAFSHWYFIFRSGHSIPRKLLLILEFLYNFVNMMFTWFQIGNFYLTFYFLLKNPLSSDSQGVNATSVTKFKPLGPHSFTAYSSPQQGYITSIVITFICSLGNRPQGSKFMYTLCMVLFALIMAVMLYISSFDIAIVIQSNTLSFGNLWSTLTSNSIVRDMFVSLLSTYGLYMLSSLLHFEPWHMFTCFLQYLLLLPSYVNILMVYAFCNLHDVSWGTKGDNTAPVSLGAVKASKDKDGKYMVEIDVHSAVGSADSNRNYDKFLKQVTTIQVDDANGSKGKRDAATKQQDYFKGFRTNLILSWLFSNMVLILVLTNDTMSGWIYKSIGVSVDGSINPYLKFIFYSVLGLSAIRFLGSSIYLVTRLICS
ncbi:chitin synthase-domain-containing protein, partial [Zopfochytrium polystomum]